MNDIGVIGLGVMGKNLILNIVDHGFKVSAFNRTFNKTKELSLECPAVAGFEKLEDFVSSLASPKKVLLMVPAGQAVDEMIKSLNPLLSKEDIVIDGGNSYYKDTIERVKSAKFNYVGCGISGGEFGARNGPAMFVGCKKSIYDEIRPIFETISAQYNGKSCCGLMGSDGAGHFVKIVHNGIEYSEMQVLQEVLSLINIKEDHKYENEIFDFLNEGRSKGYLVEICTKILKTYQSDKRVLDQILDKAEQKGTGKMCIYSAIDTDTELNSIVESVFARYTSNQKNKREIFSSLFDQKINSCPAEGSIKKIDSVTIERAFYLCKAINYIQGCNLLIKNRELHNWNYEISDVCDVWRNGCILRSDFLEVLKKIATSECLEHSSVFIEIVQECYSSLKEVILYGIQNNIYIPVMTSCLNWINGLKMNKRNGNLIQAMRDFFGRHGVVLEDGSSVNIDWVE